MSEPGSPLDTRIACVAIAAYFAAAAVLLPLEEHLRAIVGGVLVYGSIAAAGAWLGRGPIPGATVIIVAFASAVVLAFPTFPAMGGQHRIAVPVGFLGVQVATFLWLALRWDAPATRRRRHSFREVLSFAFFGAVGISVLATIPIVLAVVAGGSDGLPILWTYFGYFAGFLAAGVVYWALQRIAHLAAGRYLIGVLGGICVYGAVAPVVAVLEEDPMSFGMMVAIAGGLVGPAVAFDSKMLN